MAHDEPDTRPPTTAKLKADIDAGRTGDKVPAGDPALAPLGTDDEAAGNPPAAKERAMAAAHEQGRFGGAPPSHKPDREGNRSVVYLIVGLALVTGIVVAGAGYLLS
jgi:hypothetical protein